jgi:hypothetical protein
MTQLDIADGRVRFDQVVAFSIAATGAGFFVRSVKAVTR